MSHGLVAYINVLKATTMEKCSELCKRCQCSKRPSTVENCRLELFTMKWNKTVKTAEGYRSVKLRIVRKPIYREWIF